MTEKIKILSNELEGQRRMPFEEEWFDKSLNDIVYGYMQAFAEVYVITGQNTKETPLSYVRLSKKEFKKRHVPELINCINSLSLKKDLALATQRRNVNNAIAKYIEEDYIAISEDDKYYYFPYDPQKKYVLIDAELLHYLCHSVSKFGLKIFIYLTFQSKYHPNYTFTLSELRKAFGYADSSHGINDTLAACLTLLKSAGLIDFDFVDIKLSDAPNAVPVPKMRLLSIVSHIPEKDKKVIQSIQEQTK